MSLRKSTIFKVVGYGLAALALLSFEARVVQKVLAGEWLGDYYSAKLIHWNYGSAFILLVAIAVAGLIAGGFWLYARIRHNKRTTK